ncbi:hypothetical protein SAMD00019534_018430 [Acytostelium subglobosum LB1]|uniref:hypothetical protein n=1 Tax=Acytostelium subglobosum LB1 TaxID=1410327 RepID=UPI00064487BC|nr:hypothetical protein SAMD00019534_018430 [Acytostelium subglobosum LB1]GAM18668.1 hypothetical protein SAMD00019534_018430 [Acytostelium subglobosum LB1]|eukprot:XP_012757888.1 hypothetical protein SAMD00019534_018430 [Acytostelium subglobosum LB1]
MIKMMNNLLGQKPKRASAPAGSTTPASNTTAAPSPINEQSQTLPLPHPQTEQHPQTDPLPLPQTDPQTQTHPLPQTHNVPIQPQQQHHHQQSRSAPCSPSRPALTVTSLNDDIEKKKQSKYNHELEVVVLRWVAEVLNVPLSEEVSFYEHFKSGVLLCRLINTIKPGVVKKINESAVSFKQLENIDNYLKACMAIGLQDVHRFNSIDLYENKDISLVINNVQVLGKFAARVDGYTGPHLAGERKNVKITTAPPPPLFANGSQGNGHGVGVGYGGGGPNRGGASKKKWRKTIRPPSVAPLNLDINTKEAFKYSPELEKNAQLWIEELVGEKFPFPSFRTSLKDGVLLCKAINKLKPGTVTYINTGMSSFKQMENIANYLNGCRSLGLKPSDLFNTSDLYEEKNINLVISNIHVLANHATKMFGSAVPSIKSISQSNFTAQNKLYASLVHSRFGSAMAKEAPPEDVPELLAWMNGHLKARGLECKDISWDLKSGVLLLALLEEITSLRVGIYCKDPVLPWHFMQNIFLLLNFMRENSNFNVGTISAHDIFNGNVGSLCNLVRLIRENFDRAHFFKSVPVDIRRQRVIEEIVSTEQSYVKSLSVVFHTLIVQLQLMSESDTNQHALLSPDDVFSVFGNWENILRSHILLQREFEDRLSKWNDESTFGDIILQKCGFLKDTYKDYINNFDNSYQRIKRLRKANRFFDESVNNFEVIQDSTNGLDLASYLIMPIQRIPRYLLLLKEALKYTSSTHPDHNMLLKAKDMIRQVADQVNESKMMFDNTRKITSIQDSIFDIQINLSDSPNNNRRYIREGFLEIDESFNKNSYFFLFNDLLLYVKYKPNEDTGKEFKFKEAFPMSDMVDICDILSDDEEEQEKPQPGARRGGLSKKKKPSFELETKEFSLVLIAESEQDKRAWMDDIRSCLQNQLIEDDDQLSDLSLDSTDDNEQQADEAEAEAEKEAEREAAADELVEKVSEKEVAETKQDGCHDISDNSHQRLSKNWSITDHS